MNKFIKDEEAIAEYRRKCQEACAKGLAEMALHPLSLEQFRAQTKRIMANGRKHSQKSERNS